GGGGAGGRDVVVGVAGLDGERVPGRRRQPGDRGGGTGDAGAQGGTGVDVVPGDREVTAAGGVPGQRDGPGGPAGRARVAGRGRRPVGAAVAQHGDSRAEYAARREHGAPQGSGPSGRERQEGIPNVALLTAAHGGRRRGFV